MTDEDHITITFLSSTDNQSIICEIAKVFTGNYTKL